MAGALAEPHIVRRCRYAEVFQRETQEMIARVSLTGVWRWLLAALLLAGLPVLLHGCHGDEDNELFAPFLAQRR
jgi:hypothetical protein